MDVMTGGNKLTHLGRQTSQLLPIEDPKSSAKSPAASVSMNCFNDLTTVLNCSSIWSPFNKPTKQSRTDFSQIALNASFANKLLSSLISAAVLSDSGSKNFAQSQALGIPCLKSCHPVGP